MFADSRLRDEKLFGRLGEAQIARCRLEPGDEVQWRKPVAFPTHACASCVTRKSIVCDGLHSRDRSPAPEHASSTTEATMNASSISSLRPVSSLKVIGESPLSQERQMNPVLRAGSQEDAPVAGAICYAAFKSIADQHRFPPDFPNPDVAIELIDHLISRPDVYAVVAELDGRVVGSNFLWEDGSVGGVGPITVDPAVQNGRIGRQLMEAVIERADRKGIVSVRLVQAAYHLRSLSLYTRLGFEVREPLAVMQGPALNPSVGGCEVRTARATDLTVADRLYRNIHGHGRTSELRVAIEQGAATVVERDGRLTGYTTGIGFFGHAVAETNEDLQALIGSARSFAGPGFLVPSRNAALMRWCLQHGLRIVQPMMLMTMGPYEEPKAAFLPSVLY
ncbi:MAG: GNAT family N-acetyltransferase [Hyphomicrobiaceae bacterium]